VAARESFRAVPREYKKAPALSSDDEAHLQRWEKDDRAEQVWQKIKSAAHNNNIQLPPIRGC
jgi:hypothetical protein